MAIIQLPQAKSSMPSPVPLDLEFRAKKIIGFLQPEHLTNEWAFCDWFANAVLFQKESLSSAS